MIDKKILLKIRSGSHMYGLNTPQSDEDYMGICIPSIDYYYGLKTVEEIDESVVEKNENGRNTADSIDCKFYEIRQFFKLAIENNPNILEVLFSNEINVLEISPEGRLILANKYKFLNKDFIYKKFLAYAFSQKKKMMIKTDHYEEMLEFYDFICKSDDKTYILEIPEIKNKIKNGYIFVGDTNIPENITVKRAKDMIQKRVHRVGQRRDLILKYGMDVKFASHLCRLLFECRTLLKIGNLIFPLPEDQRQILMDIKLGNYKVEKVYAFAEELEKECNIAYAMCELPRKADYTSLNFLLIDILEKNFKNKS
jgi:hypothetical protein